MTQKFSTSIHVSIERIQTLNTEADAAVHQRIFSYKAQ